MKNRTCWLLSSILSGLLIWGVLAYGTTPIWTTPAVCSPAAGVIKRQEWIDCVQALAGEDSRAQPKTVATLPANGTAGHLVWVTDGANTNTLYVDDGSAWHLVVTLTDTQTLTNKTLTSPTINSGTLNTPTVATPTISAAVSFQVGSAGTALTNLNADVASSVADGGTVTHGMGATPTGCFAQSTVSGEWASVTPIGATTFTVPIKKNDGSGGTTQPVYWLCFKK